MLAIAADRASEDVASARGMSSPHRKSATARLPAYGSLGGASNFVK